MELNDKIAAFDQNAMGDTSGNIFGLPFDTAEAQLVILPVPWEVTVSYRAGTAGAPVAIHEASFQVDLYDPYVQDAWKLGISMLAIDDSIFSKNNELRYLAAQYIKELSSGSLHSHKIDLQAIRNKVNLGCAQMNDWVKAGSLSLLDQNKLVAVVGGDHSTPLGLLQALAERNNEFGILHIDAHADLREAYEGFEFSHASIMYNSLKIPQITHLVQVGIRDYCVAEFNLIQSDKRITTFFDRDLKQQQFKGTSWSILCDQVIDLLPDKVYLSFDIDGLDPKLCPNTGTPVPGGLEYDQSLYLIEKLVESGRTIIGFDLNEVGNSEWDANVGARLLYRLSNMSLLSNKVSSK